MKFRRIVGLLLLAAVLAVSCNGKKDVKTEAPKTWEEEVEFAKDKSVSELYELAKAEGKVVIYSMSSRLNKVKASFEEKYPEIEVVVYDMRIPEILEKFQREYQANIHTADVLFIKDADGAVQNEFVNTGLLMNYLPKDMVAAAGKEFQTGSYIPYFEMKQIFYNTEVYDVCPIDSWWDLTRPEYKGKIMVANPIQTATILGIFLSMVSHPEEMAAAYTQEFGEEIVLNGTENAGYEFINRLVANDLILTTSDGDIIKAVGAPGQADPPFGIATSSKMRKAGEKILIDVAKNLTPRLGKADPALLFIGHKCEHPNAAKLLVRWIGGETSGFGEGFKPFHVRGSWPTRKDVPPMKTQPLESLDLWPNDLDYNYKNIADMRDYWISIQ